MEIFQEFKSEYAVLIVRLIAGILFFMQGYDKIFRIHLREAGEASTHALRTLKLPSGLVVALTIVTSIAELAGGGMLILGIGILPACFVLAAVLIPVTLAMSMKEPLWNIQHVSVRLALIVFLLLVPETTHTFSLDSLLNVYGGKG